MKVKKGFKMFVPLLMAFGLLVLPSTFSQAYAKTEVKHSVIVKETAYITSFQKVHGKWVGKFDYIQWYTGKAADREFLKDCSCSKYMTGAPDKYYIRNVNPKIRTFTISKHAKYVLQTYNPKEIKWNEKVTRSQFIAFLKEQNKDNFIPFHIEITNGVITKITQQYIP